MNTAFSLPTALYLGLVDIADDDDFADIERALVDRWQRNSATSMTPSPSQGGSPPSFFTARLGQPSTPE